MIELLQEKHIDEAVSLWNAELAGSYPLRSRLLRQNVLADPHVVPEGTLAAIDSRTGELVGFVVAKASRREDESYGLARGNGWIHALFVAPERRGQGIGTALLYQAALVLRHKGVDRVALGNDLHRRLFPGIPDELAETQRWFERRGFRYRETAFDMIKTYGQEELVPMPALGEAACRVAEPQDQAELEAFMSRCFPGAWDLQHRDYWRQGGTGREYVLLEHGGKLIGFCRINDSASPLLAQNVYWSPLFEEELGGIGPLGIDEAYRGRRYGLSIVQAAIHTLQARGIRRIVIDTTPFVDFYGKLGYEVWKTYAKYDKTLA
ncbi:N-acetylglutamate synthase-like GNAT family acetyltransferase [Paenibacillus methanolicus]|uniref:N-acetylglutamate synthase-like GNAT family acetyltransferase n=2 Tax=Paenibacillus methanolicus TaxID=582686 RepID=A0A5S5BYN5_9BACL|nr:N-acetylglutamate synthase-like GNAT family acetyltransferase [Paenibacillus methanolicus]